MVSALLSASLHFHADPLLCRQESQALAISHLFKNIYVLRVLSSIHVSTLHTCLASVEGVDPLELELWMVVSRHVVLGTEFRSSGRAASALNL